MRGTPVLQWKYGSEVAQLLMLGSDRTGDVWIHTTHVFSLGDGLAYSARIHMIRECVWSVAWLRLLQGDNRVSIVLNSTRTRACLPSICLSIERLCTNVVRWWGVLTSKGVHCSRMSNKMFSREPQE